ncbi:MAG: ZIP family metal transporter [Planctomycetes bacterium]|nr:ZIP family metal transporter [Planctomycetota bacterium]
MADPLLAAFHGTLWAALGSGLGACAAFAPAAPAPRGTAALLGFAGGVMLAAALLSLLPQALALPRGGLGPVLLGFGLGVALIWALDLFVPHQHPGAPAQDHASERRLHVGVLIALAITLHNLPEGMAVGVAAAAGAGGADTGAVVWAIAAHNVVEGVLVAFPLRLAGLRPWPAFACAQVAGLAEVAAGLVAALLVTQAAWLLPAALAFAGGAMVYLVFEELLPEALRAADGNAASLGGTAGIVLVLVLGAATG